jgi:hypothetical protein
MAKGETKKTNKMLDASTRLAEQRFAANIAESQGRSNAAYEQSQGSRQSALDAISGITGMTPEQQSRLRGSSYQAFDPNAGHFGEASNLYREFINTGGVDPSKMGGAHGTWKDIMATGGWSDAAKAGVTGDVAGLRQIGKLGASSEEGRNRIRGNGVFDEFAQTGGYTPGNIADIRTRATSPISSYYSGLREDIGRNARIGGSGAGYAAALGKMGREGAREAGATSLEAELGIADRVRQGRQWGAGNVSGAEQFLGNQQMAGLQGAAGIESAMQNALTSHRLQAGGSLDVSERAIQDMTQRGKMFGGQGMESIAAQEAAAKQFAAEQSGMNERYIAGLDANAAQARAAGLGGIAGSDAALAAEYSAAARAGIGGAQSGQQGAAGLRYGAPGNNTSPWEKAAGIGAPIAASFLIPGLGMMPKPKPFLPNMNLGF